MLSEQRIALSSTTSRLPSSAVPIHRIQLDWHDIRCVIEQLERLELFNKDLLYSAIPPEKLTQVLEHGSYLKFKSGIPNLVFCCEASVTPEDKDILQVGDSYTGLWDYLEQNSDSENSVIAIYDRNKMKRVVRAEFEFLDSERKVDALAAIVIIEFRDGPKA